MKTKHRDFYTGIVLQLFSLAVTVVAFGISGDAKIVPAALGTGMMICSAVIMHNGIRQTELADGEEIQYSWYLKDGKVALKFILLTFAYFVVFDTIGYWIATLVFIVIFQRFMGVRSWKQLLLVTVGYLAVTFIVFVVILQLPIYKVGITGPLFRFIR